ncbi:MAG TPA: collagen-binding domain-containing protein [Mycobacteriales bacterium]|nr:collagen-binding domain-containing protein [Mycobacteriales bacterium]
MVAHRALRGLFTATVVLAATTTLSIVHATPAPALSPVNPVRVDVDGHPANSGFLVFVEGDTALNADESEGTLATGGDLSFNSTYNVAAHSPKDSTFTAPGDSQPTLLYVGGGVAWTGSQVLRVLNSGYTKIADSATYTARNTDQNGAKVNINIVKPGAVYGSTPRIEGTTSQPPASVATPVPSGLISIPGAFTKYRSLTTEIADCPQTVRLTDPNGGSTPIDQPYTRGARGRLTLETGTTNVLTMSTADLANLSEITFTNQPTASTPLVVNVTGSAFNGNIPNLAGIGGSQAPYILWNFPQATSIVVTGGASIEGTIYAPNAALNWRPTQNVEGNIIAASFTHGPSSLARKGQVREIHDFPFATTISCSASHPTGTLTLVKHVDNSGGGTGVASDWTLSADGPQTVTGPGNSADVTSVTVDTGIYELTESGGLANYTSGSWSCTGGLLVGHFVTVTKNPEVTCEITNSYHPPPPPTGALTLIKHVDNTGGGIAGPSDWTLTASGPDIVTGAGNSDAVTDVTTPAGDYDLSESGGPSDYTSGTWSCAGGDLTGSTVTITDGSNVTCEITNTYHPPPPPTGTLTLVKHVDNSGGGTATAGEWTLTAAGPDSIHGAAGSDAVTGVAVGAGDYDLSESGGPDNYTPGSWSCTGGTLTGDTVTVTDGADVTCEITNTYHPPPSPPAGSITLVKHVKGGTGVPSDWTLSAAGPQTVRGPANSEAVTGIVVPIGSYTLTESGGPTGYKASKWTCNGKALSGDSVRVKRNALVTCEITNTSGHSQVEPGGATGHPPGSSTSGLAFTGANIATMIAGALACFTLGGILVLATRRRGPRLPAALTDEELS